MANIDKIQPIGTSTQYDLTAQKVKYTSITSLSSFIDANGLIITSAGGNNTVTDKPENVDAFGCFTYKTANGWYGQLLTSSNAASGLYWRTATALSGGWKKVLDSSNYSDYTVTKTGTGASGTWGISVTGSAASATKASQDGDGNVITSTYVKKAGDTLTGALNTANGTWNKIGDDSQIGDINEAGTLGLQGLNGNTAIRFTTYNQSTKTSGGKITWDGTKFIITSTVETSISGNAATATTAKYLYTGNYAPTYGVNRLEYWNSSGTTGDVVANAVCYPTSDWYHFIRMNHGNSNGYYVELASHFHGDNLYWRRVANGTAYAWKKIAWTDSNITGNAATATDADKVDGYHSSDLWRKDGGVWNPGANITLGATANNQEWSFDITRNGYTGTYWHVWDSSLYSMLKVTADDGKVRAPYGFVGNLTGNADSATTAAALSSDAGSTTIPVYFTNGKPTTCSTTLGVSITGSSASCTGNAATATALTSNAGSATVPIYFSDGKPVQCSTTLGVSITGNASTSTKATQDSDGKQINTTYLKLSGGTMTGTLTALGSQYVDSYSGALNMNNSNIYGLNSIYTADSADNAAEGIHFYRDATHVDTLWMNSGDLLFVPNRALGTSTSKNDSYKVLHSNNYTSYTVKKDGTGASGTWGISISGNAATATALQTARTINGTSFNGSTNITTVNWGTARNVSISDADASNTGTAVSVNGSAAVTLKLPATIKATLKGNADTATKATQDSDGNQINTTYTKKSELLDLVYPIGAIYISVVNTSPATLFGGTWEQIEDTFLLSAGTNHVAGTTGGSETVTLTTAEMPAHTHNGPSHTHTGPSHTHTGPSHTHSGPNHTHSLSSHYHWVGPQNGTANSNGWHTHASWASRVHTPNSGNNTVASGGGVRVDWDQSTFGAGSHSHSVSTNAVNSGGPSNNTSGAGGTGATGAAGTGATGASGTGATGASGTGATSSTGSGGAHNNMPPYLTVYMWKRTA